MYPYLDKSVFVYVCENVYKAGMISCFLCCHGDVNDVIDSVVIVTATGLAGRGDKRVLVVWGGHK